LAALTKGPSQRRRKGAKISIGRGEGKVDERPLKRYVKKWFFFSPGGKQA